MNILVIGSDPDDAHKISYELENRIGFNVRTEHSIEPILRRIPEAEIDCIISRWALEETDGIQLLQQVRDIYPDIPFIFYALRGSEQIAENAIQEGATDYVIAGRSGKSNLDTLTNSIVKYVKGYEDKRWKEKSKRRQIVAISIAASSVVLSIIAIIISII